MAVVITKKSTIFPTRMSKVNRPGASAASMSAVSHANSTRLSTSSNTAADTIT